MSIFNIFSIDCKGPLGLINTCVQETNEYINDEGYEGQITTSVGKTIRGNNAEIITFKHHDYEFKMICSEEETDMYHFANGNNVSKGNLFEENISSDNYDSYEICHILQDFFVRLQEIDPMNNHFFGADNDYNIINLNYKGPTTFILKQGKFKLANIPDEELQLSGPANNFSIKIMDWMKDNKDVMANTQNMQLNEKMDFLGKYLMKQKMNDEIESTEFIDLFKQAGIIGFSDKSLINFYELIK